MSFLLMSYILALVPVDWFLYQDPPVLAAIGCM